MRKEKKSKCPKKNFQSVEKGKNVSVKFWVFGKKMEIERKVLEKKIKVFLDENLKWKILLSSCSLVGLYVDFASWSCDLLRENEVRDFYLLGSYPLVGRYVDWKVQSHG